jgi:TonB family protein
MRAKMKVWLGVALCVTLLAARVVSAAQNKAAPISATGKVRVYVPGKDVTSPELLPVDYSKALTDNCENASAGETEFSFIVDASGMPRDIAALQTTCNSLDQFALKILRNDRFKPALLKGSPVAAGQTAKIKLDACPITVTDATGQQSHRLHLHSVPDQQFAVWKDAPRAMLLTSLLETADSTQVACRIGGKVTAPIAIYAPPPQFSEEAKYAKYQGEVMVQAVVDANGMVQNPHVVRPLGMGLDEKAIENVKQYRFIPAKKDGTPVPVYLTIAINFRL